MRTLNIQTFLVIAFILSACGDKAKITAIVGGNIPVTATKISEKTHHIRTLIEFASKSVDSIKAPIIGHAAKTLIIDSPESTLMNFAADALLTMAEKKCDEKIDIAITNKGGLRSEINKGTITFGDIYNVFPFDNTLALLTLDGEQLMQLFSEIAIRKGEAISGARLTITPDGKLIDAKVNGKNVEPEKRYRIATSDYLSQGNDGLTTLAKGCKRKIYSHTIRELMIDYISTLQKEGKPVDSETYGRITIIK